MELLSIYLSQSLAKEMALKEIENNFARLFHLEKSPYLDAALYHAAIAFTILRNCSTPYHNSEHTLNVLICGLSLLEGKHLLMGPIDESVWANVVVSLCYHDIGYARNICSQDNGPSQVIAFDGATVDIPENATDAFLTPYHVVRSMIFAKEKAIHNQELDIDFICECIEKTTFDVHEEQSDENTANIYPKIVQTADLVGQMGDLNYFNTLPLLYFEIKENGTAELLKINSPNELRQNYPDFFKKSVIEKISPILPLLEVTKRGELWISKLNYNLFSEDNRVKISTETQKIMGDLIYTLGTSTSAVDAYHNLLKIMCEHYFFQIGHIFLVDENSGKLKSGKIWYSHDSDTERFIKFQEMTEKMVIDKGKGLAGEVFEEHEPKWIADLSKLNKKDYPRAEFCKQLQLKSAIAFPLTAGEKVIGVVELFSSRFAKPTESDLNFIGYLTKFVARINVRESG